MDPFGKARLGTTSVEVSRLGLGTAPLGGWPAAMPRDQGVATLRRAWDAGVRTFDTAPYYGLGLSEHRVGDALRSLPDDSFVLATKVGRLLRPESNCPVAQNSREAAAEKLLREN